MNRAYKYLPVSILVNLSNKSGSKFSVKFKLYDHPGTTIWLRIMQETLALGANIIDGGAFFGRTFNDLTELSMRLESNIHYHNKWATDHGLATEFHIPLTIDNPPTQDRLNRLHEYFEALVEHPRIRNEEEEVKANLMDMNINIHKTESTLSENDGCHVELASSHYIKTEMTDEAYGHFSTDFFWGELILTYGITGVPTMSAFRSNTAPTPQNFITNGMIMAFWGDTKFNQWDELTKWLAGLGMAATDPKCALGYLPLGILEGVASLDRASLLKRMKEHSYVDNFQLIVDAPEISVESPKHMTPQVLVDVPSIGKEALWPFDPEIHYNLDLVPYLDLKISFDAKKLFDEAFKARDYFVTHREYDQKSSESAGKWKSLGLRTLFGDYTKTNYHTEYNFEGNPFYANTVFAQLCPETIRFLNTLTDLNKCERIRFMLLEPGASIKVHRDSTRPTSLAVNISLNMPDGCEMHAQLNADGSENPYTVKIPFKDSGSVILFNNAKYHKVVNNSSIPRIHIIFHGPIRFTDNELISLAKTQNNISDRIELIKKLIQKKGHLGESIESSKELLADWISSGLHADSLPTNMTLAVYDHKNYYPGNHSAHHLEKRTLPTLFPLSTTVIQEEEWDDFILANFQLDKDIVILMAAGTFLNNLNGFISGVIKDANDLLIKGWPAAGHLMDFNNGKHLPYFHEQFLIVNLKVWNKIGRPRLGRIFSPQKGELKAAISELKKHDDYTPEYIKAPGAGDILCTRSGEFGWGSEIILKAVEHGFGVQNLSDATRDSKRYSYPRDELKVPKEEIEKVVSDKLDFSKREVFYFNNEPLHTINLPDFQPDKFVSVAAGMKPFQILKQFKANSTSEIHFRDFSAPALSYMKAISSTETIHDLENTIVERMKADPLKKYSPESASSLLTNTIRDYFDGSPETLMQAVKLSKKATFEEVNLVSNPLGMINLFKPREKFFVWISNAFYNNQLYLILTKAEAEASLIKLVNGIAEKTDLRAFQYKDTHTFVFGKGIDFIKGVLTDGSIRDVDFEKASWHEISPG